MILPCVAVTERRREQNTVVSDGKALAIAEAPGARDQQDKRPRRLSSTLALLLRHPQAIRRREDRADQTSESPDSRQGQR
jgi:hypothetical protein